MDDKITTSRLGSFCGRVIEAGWLLALVLIPLFFNPYTQRAFEADKTFICRSLACLMLIAWLVKFLETRNQPLNLRETWQKTPVVFFVGLLGLIFFVSSLFSIVPRLSLGGFYLRDEGFITFIAYLVIFFLIWQELKTKKQLHRLLFTIVLVSVPISLYSICQSPPEWLGEGLDPLRWRLGDVRARATSTFGGPIYLAAYLIMVLPITLYLAIRSFAVKNISGTLLGAFYSLIILCQIYGFWVARSRGPMIGLLTAFFFFTLIYGALKRKKMIVVGLIALVLCTGTLLVLLNLPNSPLESTKKHFGFLGRITTTTGEAGRTIQVRKTTWNGALSILRSNPTRLAFGHGLESLFFLYHRHTPPDFARFEGSIAIPDHSHNETFDLLITGGIFGLIVYLFILIMIIYAVFKWLGLIAVTRDRRLFIGLLIGTFGVGLLILALMKNGFAWLGLMIPFTLVTALAIYLIIHVFTRPDVIGARPAGAPAEEPDKFLNIHLLLIALISAVLAHFVEVQFLFGVTTTNLYLWAYLAVILGVVPIAALKKTAATDPEISNGPKKKKKKSAAPAAPPAPVFDLTAYLSQFIIYAVLAGLIIGILFFELARLKSFADLNKAIWFFITVWLFSGILIVTKITAREKKSFAWHFNFYLLYLVLSGTLGLAFWSMSSFLLTQLNIHKTVAFALNSHFQMVIFLFLWIAINLFTLAVLFPARSDKTGSTPLVSSGFALKLPFYLILCLAAGVFIYQFNIKRAQADVACRFAVDRAEKKQWDVSLEAYKLSLKLEPKTGKYYDLMQRSYTGQGNFSQAEKKLKEARAVEPLNFFLVKSQARLYRDWSQKISPPAEREKKLDQAITVYEQLAAMTPLRPSVFRDWAEIYILKKDYRSAVLKYRQALALDESRNLYILLGNTYRQMNKPDETMAAYEKVSRWDVSRSYDLLAPLGQKYFEQKKYEASIRANLILIKFRPENYIPYQNAAVGYDTLNQFATALRYSQKALPLAPPEKKKVVRDFIKQLENKMKKKQGQKKPPPKK